MTVDTEVSSIRYTGIIDGVALAAPFPVQAVGEIQVLYATDTVAVLGLHYTVALDPPDYETATVTPLTGFALLSAGSIAISRVVPYLNTNDIPGHSTLSSSRLEQMIDRVVFMTQQLRDLFTRALRFPANDPPSSIGLLPPAAVRANNVLSFDAFGKPQAGTLTTSIVFVSTFVRTFILPISSLLGWKQFFGDVVSPLDFGAVEYNPAAPVAYTTQLLNACQSGYIVDGGGRTFGVSGFIQITSANFKGLRNIKLIRVGAEAASDRLILIRGRTDWFLENVEVDGNISQVTGSGVGTLGQTALISVDASGGTPQRFRMSNVKCKNFGAGNGISISFAVNFTLIDCHVYDALYNFGPTPATDPIDDCIQGFALGNCSNFRLIGCTARNLTGILHPGSVATPSMTFTRGIAIGGCTEYQLDSCRVTGVDQGVDTSGNQGNSHFAYVNCEAVDCMTWGFKFANTPYHGTVSNCVAVRPGRGGFVISGMSGPTSTTFYARNLQFSDCLVVNVGFATIFGYANIWSSGRYAYSLISFGAVDVTYPRAVKFYTCGVINDVVPVTIDAGFSSNVPFISAPAAGSDEDELVECINCWGKGLAGAPFQQGMMFPFAQVRSSIPQTLTNNINTDLVWDLEDSDTAGMHSTAGTTSSIYIKKPGFYRICAHIAFTANVTGTRKIIGQINGVNFSSMTDERPGNATLTTICQIDATYEMAKGDYVKISAIQNSGGALNADLGSSLFSVTKVM